MTDPGEETRRPWYCVGCGAERPRWDPKDRCNCGFTSVRSEPPVVRLATARRPT